MARAHRLALVVLVLVLQSTTMAWAACEPWVAQVVSVQGLVEARRGSESTWGMVRMGDRYCSGDSIRVLERSRAAVLLPNDAILRLDQSTTVTFSAPAAAPGATWVDLARGVAHFLSRLPRGLRVLTPFVNGTVEGTEFVFEVGADAVRITVLEGHLAADNPRGRLELARGQVAVTRLGQAPAADVVARPRNAVRWALHYPAVVDFRPEEFPDAPGADWPAAVRASVEAYRRGDVHEAFSRLELVARPRQARVLTYRAALLLGVGRVDEARADLAEAERLAPADGEGLALQAVIAVVQDDRDGALAAAERATATSPRSAAAWVALSYARQARFDLPGALRAAEEAVRVDEAAALAWARLAELQLSVGDASRARRAADRAARAHPGLARTQTVLGFALLIDGDAAGARDRFEQAIVLDQADPLPRLGLGLARIRAGDLEEGRQSLEVAASLDPGNALVRSYLGKAYHEERREREAGETLASARRLDAADPTPWFYDALRQQSRNRPVEALRALERAIELNDRRAVYRSRLLLDEDLAARTAGQGRLYQDLGFGQLALTEGWRSLDADPGNYSAHRFLADTYATLSRHEIARVSELLVSQLLQPLNTNPVQPRLAGAGLFIPVGLEPAAPAFNEFSPLFNRNRAAFHTSGILGTRGTVGDEWVVAGLWGNLSLSLGQFHYETNGFRANNDLDQDIYNAFLQYRLTSGTSAQVELRLQETERGDLGLRFFPDSFLRELRERDLLRTARFGLRHAFGPGADLLASFIYHDTVFESEIEDVFRLRARERGYTAEVQQILRFGWVDVVAGGGHVGFNRQDDVSTFFGDDAARSRVSHGNLYAYVPVRPLAGLTVTLGVSADFFSGGVRDRDQVNPKLGLTWMPLPGTTVRAAVFRTLRRTLATNQTLEPTQVAGFAQFFDDVEATDAWRYGVGLDQKITRTLFAGAELSGRRLEVPFTDLTTGVPEVRTTDWRETLLRAYLYWAALDWLAVTTEYEFERFDRDDPLVAGIRRSRTHRVPASLRVFGPCGFFARVTGTLVAQDGTFVDDVGGLRDGSSRFVVVDLAAGYRLPGRFGIFSLEVRNLLDQGFRFQDTDPSNPRIVPGRLVLGKLTLAF